MLRAIAALVLAVMVAERVAAQDAPPSRRLPPATLFAELLRVISVEDWARVERVSGLMAETGIDVTEGPLAGLGTKIQAAVVARDRRRALDALARLVGGRATEMIRQAGREPDEAVRRRVVREAFTEFLTLTPVLKPTQFQLHQQIEAGFRAVHASAGAGGATLAAAIEKLIALLRQVGV